MISFEARIFILKIYIRQIRSEIHIIKFSAIFHPHISSRYFLIFNHFYLRKMQLNKQTWSAAIETRLICDRMCYSFIFERQTQLLHSYYSDYLYTNTAYRHYTESYTLQGWLNYDIKFYCAFPPFCCVSVSANVCSF